MTKSSGELWREIEETRLVKPPFEWMAARDATYLLAVSEWADCGHLGKLQAILRWGTRDQVVEVFENSEDVAAGFDGVAILPSETMGPTNRDSSAGVLARITYGTVRALTESSSAIKKAVSGKRERLGRRLWHKLFTIDSYIPVHDPVYVAEAMDRMIACPTLTSEKVGAELLVEHVRKAVGAALREQVMGIIRKAIEGRDLTFAVDEGEISTATAMALSGADLGRFHEELPGLPGTRLVSVGSPLVKSVILDREPWRGARKRTKVLEILKGV